LTGSFNRRDGFSGPSISFSSGSRSLRVNSSICTNIQFFSRSRNLHHVPHGRFVRTLFLLTLLGNHTWTFHRRSFATPFSPSNAYSPAPFGTIPRRGVPTSRAQGSARLRNGPRPGGVPGHHSTGPRPFKLLGGLRPRHIDTDLLCHVKFLSHLSIK
jgi:hypothetical protein